MNEYSGGTGLPAHASQERPWRQKQRGGAREDRMLDRVITRVPPRISGRDIAQDPADVVAGERALQAAARADGAAGPGAAALARFMTRTESIASSRIEHIEVGMDDLARAVAGSRAHAAALSMVAAAEALQALQRDVGARGRLELDDLLEAHRLLMGADEDLGDRAWAGRLREDQNWIGGSQYSPRGALYIPPPADLVPDLLDDLLVFVNRDDVPVGLQVAVAHAQFESIHPFTDGNGRIGRALISAVLQRRGVTRNAVIPAATGLLALREEYFAGLGHYREGRIGPAVDVLSRAVVAAADEALVSITRLREMPETWRAEVGARARSTVDRLLSVIHEHPTVTGDDIGGLVGVSSSAAYEALGTLEQTGILREVTGRRRDRIWVVSDVVGEIEDFEHRVRERLLAPG